MLGATSAGQWSDMTGNIEEFRGKVSGQLVGMAGFEPATHSLRP
jgi:hypothetical protein